MRLKNTLTVGKFFVAKKGSRDVDIDDFTYEDVDQEVLPSLLVMVLDELIISSGDRLKVIKSREWYE